MTPPLSLFCAIDLLAGRAVRLVKGDFAAVSDFGDPLELAGRFLRAGAPWLHLVDLDAARTGEPANRDVVLEIAEVARRAGARVEVGGGIRDGEAAAALLASGVDRVVLGTAAVEAPRLVTGMAARHPGRVAVALDFRRGPDGTLVPTTRGWTAPGATDLATLLGAWEDAPLAALVVTSIARDGTGEGPDLDGISEVLDATALEVVASGGIGRAADLTALRRLRSPLHRRRPVGVVVGRVLADGGLEVAEAVAACAASA